MPTPQRYSPRQLAYLEAMGIPAWEQRHAHTAADVAATANADPHAVVSPSAPSAPATHSPARAAAPVADTTLPPTEASRVDASAGADASSAPLPPATVVGDTTPLADSTTNPATDSATDPALTAANAAATAAATPPTAPAAVAAGLPLDGFPDWLARQPLQRLQLAASDAAIAAPAPTADVCIVLDTWSDPQRALLPEPEQALLTAMLRAINLSLGSLPVLVPTRVPTLPAASQPSASEQGAAVPTLSGEGLSLDECCSERAIVLVLALAAAEPVQQPAAIARLRKFQGAALAGNRSLYITCHPRLLLQQQALKREAWNDLKLVQAALARLQPGTPASPEPPGAGA